MNEKFDFTVDFNYTDRKTKQKWVSVKYKPILFGNILDVGADQGYLKEYLSEGVSYSGLSYGISNLNVKNINLEKERLPFLDKMFDCVLCLDVLEHLDNIHYVFDELCRVSKTWVIISLPNPLANIYNMLRFGDYKPGKPIKFYGLPLEPPKDRHKWFYTLEEAERFIHYRAGKNGMSVYQTDYFGIGSEGNKLKRFVREFARSILFRRDFNFNNLYVATLWVVLKKVID